MFQKLLILLTIAFCTVCKAQITFEKGYVINNEGQKIQCFIKNMEWKYNPTSIVYKITENGKTINAPLGKIQAFEIYESSKYIRQIVAVDKSSLNINSLGNEKNPVYVTDTVFLKVLIEGKASLYKYRLDDAEKFFFKNTTADTIAQLIYIKYLESESEVGINKLYKQQLANSLTCGSIGIDEIEKLDFKE
jgi:hypothetical protein